MAGASRYDKLCHSVFGGKGDGKDFLARDTNIHCGSCGGHLFTYYCEEGLFLVDCERCKNERWLRRKIREMRHIRPSRTKSFRLMKMANHELSILKNTIEQMAANADDKGKKDFDIRLTIEDALSLCKLAPVRHGEWEFPILQDGDENDPRCKCSECGSIETPLARHRYCPNCGAKMDGGADHEAD